MRNNANNKLGKLLRQRRTELGLSLHAVAELAGIGKAQLSRIETGERSPKPDTLAALGTALDTPLADLYEAADVPMPHRLPSIRPYLRRAYDLPEDAVDEMERYFQRITHEYGIPSEPSDGEDELPE
jgi:transcriptional regulator with XRE-family HTH domain